MSGIQVTRTTEGNVKIEAVTPKGTARLTVTPDYARRVAAQLIAASQGAQAGREQSSIEAMIEGLFRGMGGRR